MNIEQFLNYKNQLLLADLRKDFQIDFETKEIDYCKVISKNRHSTIYYNPKHVNNDSIAHELLHIKLDRYYYSIGNHIYLLCKNNIKLGKVFCKFLCDYIGNCLDHYKMYPSYIEMGCNPENFLVNGLDEKCSLKDIKLLNLNFLGMYNAKAIDRYIGYLISIYADHVSNDYREHLRLLKQMDSDLFDIVSRFWKNWKVFDIENIDPIYNSDIDLVENFISDMKLWIENKIIMANTQ